MSLDNGFYSRLSKFTRKILQLLGAVRTINSQSIRVVEEDENGKVTRCRGTVTVTDGGAGYAVGCLYFKTDGSIGSVAYINEGSTTSCDFNVIESSASNITSVTASTGLTGGGTEGAVTLSVDETYLRYATVSLTNAEVLALRATPKELVAAPGAGKLIEFISATLLFDYTTAYTETADNLGIKFQNGSGVQVSDTIETTGFLDATADTITFARKGVDSIVAKTGAENKALVLHNVGDGEFGGGNAANALRVKVAYRIHATGF